MRPLRFSSHSCQGGRLTRRRLIQRSSHSPGTAFPGFCCLLVAVASFGVWAQPAAPADLAVAPGDAEATLTWKDPSDDAITRYEVRHGTGADPAFGSWSTVSGSGATTTEATVTGLANGMRYAFEVRAVSSDGEGATGRVWASLASSPATAVTIPDAALRGVIERGLKKGGGATITQGDMATLAALNASFAGVTSLRGLEHAVNLRSLLLSLNGVSDLSPLSGVTALTSLRLDSNVIADLSPLSGLTALTSLNLANNAIADVSALAGLTALTSLALDGNKSIADLSPLAPLTKLQSLNLNNNSVADLSGLDALTKLTTLQLASNSITDVSLLGALTELKSLALDSNSIEDVAPLATLAKLTALGLSRNSIADVSPLATLTALTELHLVDNSIERIAPLASLTALTTLGLNGNSIAEISPLARMTALKTLVVADNSITDISPLAGLTALTWLNLADNSITNLAPLTDMTKLQFLDLFNNSVSDISVLANLEALVILVLSANLIEDISPLSGLTALEELGLFSNLISEVPSLSGLKALRELGISGNSIVKFSLSDLPVLEEIDLSDNSIVDLAVSDMPLLKRVFLSGNAITSLSLSELPSLVYLDLSDNALANVSRLAGLVQLRTLDLSDNALADVSPLAGLLDLRNLDLSNNSISTVGPLAGLSMLGALYLDGNSVRNLQPLSGLATLTWLDLKGNSIADLTPLSGHSFLALRLEHNRIEDIEALTEADWFQEASVGLRGNPLSRDSLEQHVPALRADGVTVFAGWFVPLMPAAADPNGRQGFVRVVNRSDAQGTVLIHAVDDSGYQPEAVRLDLGGSQTTHFNSGDLERGNPVKGLPAGVGTPKAGNWRLELESTLDIEVLAYVRTADGFLTSMHDLLPKTRDFGLLYRLQAATFNPASNSRQRSSLRIIHPSFLDPRFGALQAAVHGVDDEGWRGAGNRFFFNLPSRGVKTFWATDLEQPERLRDGEGKWRLAVETGWPTEAMSLLSSPTGHLTNLSTAPRAGADGRWRVPLFPADPAADDETGRHGFARVSNLSYRSGDVEIWAVDDAGVRIGPVSLSLDGRETAHFNSRDLERGNAGKGIPQGVGAPTEGGWRLELSSDLEIRVSAYIRTRDGFLSSMHDVAPFSDGAARVAVFNPASNRRQQSLLRLVNNSDADTRATISGVDDAGQPGGPMYVTVPANEALRLTAPQLESREDRATLGDGAANLEGELGDGAGKWRLAVESDPPLTVMSLMLSPTGHLTNLSTVPKQ